MRVLREQAELVAGIKALIAKECPHVDVEKLSVELVFKRDLSHRLPSHVELTFEEATQTITVLFT